MKNLHYIIRIISTLLFWFALIWVSRNPVELGRWYGAWQKGQVSEFNNR